MSAPPASSPETPETPAEAPAQRRGVWHALRDNPRWRRLYAARTLSLFGNWLNTLAIVHLLGEQADGSALAIALVFVLKQIPTVLLGPLAGVLADRLDRKRLMVVCDLLDAALALGFLVLALRGVGFVYLLAGLQIAVATLFEPARQASVPNLVARRDLVAANALASVTWSIMFAVGTTVGGVVLATLGWQVAMVLDAATYLGSAILIATITFPARRAAASGGGARAGERGGRPPLSALLGIDDVVAGVRYIRRDPMVRHLIAVKCSWGAMGAVTLFLTLLGMRASYRMLDSTDLSIAALWAARAVGTGIGPFLARAYAGEDERRLRQTIAAGFLLGLVCYAAVPLAATPAITIPLVVLAHIGGAMVWVMSSVLLQMTVPDMYRGRIFAAELALVMLTNSLSNLAYASIIDGVWMPARSIEQTMWIACGVFAVIIGRWLWVERSVSTAP